MTICYFTVVTRNYLAYADALYESLVNVSPECKFCCLVVDAVQIEDEELLKTARFEILYPHNLGIRNFSEMCIYYNAFELCNALKAAAMRYIVFDLGCDTGVYLDSDILVFGSFDPIIKGLGSASFGFTPHFTTPLPDDGHQPNDLTFLQAGIFNGGVWIFTKNDYSKQVLEWLIDASEIYGFNNQSIGMFVDQKLVCQAAGIFNRCFLAINDVGCNVAYWNLHERVLEYNKDGFYVNSKPLVCFHYSGYAPGSMRLSAHSSRFDDLAKESVALRKILERYTDLVERSVLRFTRDIPYRFSRLGGVELDALTRKYYFDNGSALIPVGTKLLLRLIRRVRNFLDAMEVLLSRKTSGV
jgi:hypothetical protein